MSRVTVVACKDFSYAGRTVYAGQGVEMEAIDASIAARRGEVSLDPAARPTYQTRDMVAAPVAPAVVVQSPAAPVSRRRRQPGARQSPRTKSLSV